MSFEIAPLRALRFHGPDLAANVAPPYDVISPEAHRELLDRSPRNIVRLTLGERPGARADYLARAGLLEAWRGRGVLREDPRPALQVYGVDYAVPGEERRRRSFRGLLALGSLHDFAERVVYPHERTFADVVDDRYRVLDVTRTHLELILVLHSDPQRRVDTLLAEAAKDPPAVEVEARPGETHALWPIRDPAAAESLKALLRGQHPIIADGHHRYTTSCLYRQRNPGAPGAGWQPMVLGNLHSDGLSILATHRLVSLGGRTEEALHVLEERLPAARDGAAADLEVESREGARRFQFPPSLRSTRSGAAATGYALLHDVVLGDWLKPLLDDPDRRGGAGGEGGGAVRYFKEGTGEREALRRGEGDLLFRMKPVAREEFLRVVEGGEVFPHKTTFFYPKLWSGLVLWTMAEPER